MNDGRNIATICKNLMNCAFNEINEYIFRRHVPVTLKGALYSWNHFTQQFENNMNKEFPYLLYTIQALSVTVLQNEYI